MPGRFVIASALFLAAFVIREAARHPLLAGVMGPYSWLPFVLVPAAAFIIGSIRSILLAIILGAVAGVGYAVLVLGLG